MYKRQVLDMPYAPVDSIAKMIPNELNITIDKELQMNHELRELYQGNEEVHLQCLVDRDIQLIRNHLRDRIDLCIRHIQHLSLIHISKTEFMNRMSHDVRTPINGIMGMLDIIRKNRQDEAKVDD